MRAIRSFLSSLYLRPRLFVSVGAVVVLFVLAYPVPGLLVPAQLALAALVALLAVDVGLLYSTPDGVHAQRLMGERLSNGDENSVEVRVENAYRFRLHAEVLEELPHQFQIRDARHRLHVPSAEARTVRYTVRPVERGVYSFGALNVYASTILGLAARRYRFEVGREVPVYPSFLQMRQYELLAISNRLTEVGVKKQRRVGHTMEFDHIRDYVRGDDVRSINSRATARRGHLMVNQHRDERAQPVVALLDMGRAMRSPFGGMTLLDYSVNAALVLANIALLKGDRAGVLTFANTIGPAVAPERRSGQIYRIQELLYNLDTGFLEPDYARLYTHVRRTLRGRSLLLLFTNFETRASMRRQLPYLRALARQHVVVAIFFENTELRGLIETRPETTEDVYVQTIAEGFAHEKREIVAELAQVGIHAVLTPPAELSVNTINKYLELKARGTI